MSVADRVELVSRDGGVVPALVRLPEGPGPHPAVVVGVEAYGINAFGVDLADRLAALGYVAVLPDYYRGNGLADPEDYLDFDEVIRYIDALDFTRATHDLLAGVRYAAALPQVDASRIVLWGYCTGATLALLAAELSDTVAAAVLFFPSQPTFAELDAAHPVHPIDLLWALRCPTLIHYGSEDGVMTAEGLDDLRDRLTRWSVDHQVNVYPGAGHAFCAPVAPLRHAEACEASWAQTHAFLARALAG